MSVQRHPGIEYPYASPVPPAPLQRWSAPGVIAPVDATLPAPGRPPFRSPAPPRPQPMPGPFYPAAGWQPAPYPVPVPRSTARNWVIAGVAAAAVLTVTVTGLALATGDESQPASSSMSTVTTAPPTIAPPAPTTTPAPPAVPVSALPGMLADPASVATTVGAAAMTVVPDSHPDAMWRANVDNPNCLGVYHPAEEPVYQGSRWTATQGQSLREAGTTSRHTVIQAVVSFPTAQAATAFATQQEGDWTRCLGRSITATYPKNGSETFSVTTVNNRGGVLTAVLTEEGASGWGCQRAMTTRSNVVVDVAACGFAPTDQAARIATQIAGRGA